MRTNVSMETDCLPRVEASADWLISLLPAFPVEVSADCLALTPLSPFFFHGCYRPLKTVCAS